MIRCYVVFCSTGKIKLACAPDISDWFNVSQNSLQYERQICAHLNTSPFTWETEQESQRDGNPLYDILLRRTMGKFKID